MTTNPIGIPQFTAGCAPTHIGTANEAQELAEHLQHLNRHRPCIVVTTRVDADQPVIDLPLLVEEVDGDADIYVLQTGHLSWTFARALPAKTEVFGGAVRLYPVDLAWVKDPYLSPLLFVNPKGRGPQKVALRVAELARGLSRPSVYTTTTPILTADSPPNLRAVRGTGATSASGSPRPSPMPDLARQVLALSERVTSAEADLAHSRREVMRLRAATAASDTARQRAQRRARKAPTDATESNGDVAAFLNPDRQFRWEVECGWARRIPASEKDRRPIQPYVLGPEFLASLGTVGGIDHAKVVDVVVEIVTGLVDEVNGRQLHQLRRVGRPAEVRADGATCWRASIQARTPSARRIHFWRAADALELSRVVLHDDMNP